MRSWTGQHGVVGGGRRRHMFVEASVLVEREHEDGAVPLGTRGDGAIHPLDESLTGADVAVRMVVVGDPQELCDGIEIGIDPRDMRERALGRGVEELRVRANDAVVLLRCVHVARRFLAGVIQPADVGRAKSIPDRELHVAYRGAEHHGGAGAGQQHSQAEHHG